MKPPSSPAMLLGAIARILTYAGATTRPHRLEIVSRIAGRDLETTKDLSLSEQRSVLRYLRMCEDVHELQLLVEQHRPAAVTASAPCSLMDELDKLCMPAAEIGQTLNRQGCGRCPWCRTGGPMTVGEFGVAWRCGHARRIPPLHATEKTTAMCKLCTPNVLLRAVA